jgi:hypothetical protein
MDSLAGLSIFCLINLFVEDDRLDGRVLSEEGEGRV